jgi:GMP synthase-like glutamine amidotransferase
VAVVTVLHHLDKSSLGHVGAPLRAAGLELDERVLLHGGELPEPGTHDGLVVLGGDQSAVDADADPLLAREAQLLRDSVDAGVPVLGICLGGQLLAHALGGRVRHVGRVVEWRSLRKTPAAQGDPLFGVLPEPVPALHWTEDVFDAPPGADVLVEPAPAGVAAFRLGSAWAIQYHPDVDRAVLDGWLVDYGDQVADREAFAAASAEWLDAQARASEALFGAFARVVLRR